MDALKGTGIAEQLALFKTLHVASTENSFKMQLEYRTHLNNFRS